MEVVYVHQYPATLIPLVADLLNIHWPRSIQTRIASLEKSTEGLPLHLALLNSTELEKVKIKEQEKAAKAKEDKNGEEKQDKEKEEKKDEDKEKEKDVEIEKEEKKEDILLIGCSTLAKVVDPNFPGSVLIENVLVNPALRSKGYGRMLMEQTESIARKLGYTTAVLSTTDKEQFYGHLGYETCLPVTTGSGADTLLSSERMSGIMHLFGSKNVQKGPKVVWMKRTL